MKKLFIFLILILLTLTANAALTNRITAITNQTGYWWNGDAIKDQGQLLLIEIQTIVEAWALDGSNDTITFANGLTIDNAVDNIMEWNENSDELKWTFGSNKIALSSTDVLEISWGTIYLGFTEISAPSGNPASNNGWLYTKDDGGTTKLYFEDSTGTVTDILASASGNTLNAAYDQGGAGVGRTITADTGAFALTNTDADTAFLMTINAAPGSAAALGGIEITVGVNSTENGIEFENTGSGDDIQGTGDTWAVDSSGVGTFSSIVTSLIVSTGTTTLGDGTGTVAINSSSWDITTAGAVSGLTTLSMSGDLTNSGGDVILSNGKVVKGSVTNTETVGMSAYDVDGAAYVATFQLTNGNTIAATLGTNVETIAIDSTTWDVSTAGVFSGLTGLTVDGDSIFNDQIAVNLNANDEEITITGTATNMTAAGQTTMIMAAQDSVKHILILQQTPDADADNEFLLLEDNAGDDKFEIEEGGNTIWTLDAAAIVKVDAATTTDTSTAGVIDLDVTSATANNKAVYIDYELDDGSSGTQYGIYIDLDDDAAGGDETFHALSVLNSAGTNATTIGLNVANTIDTGVNIVAGAASVAIAVDAAATDHTGATGVIDIEFDSITADSEAVNIKATAIAGGSGQSVAGMEIELDNDSDNGSDILYGLIINVTDSTATGKEKGIYVKGAGIDAALQADTGYIRIGTGGTPDETLGDDTMYVEGTIEVDGVLYADGGVQIDNTTLFVATVELSNADLDDLKNTPKELVAAPSAGSLIEFVSIMLLHDYGGTNVWTETNDNLVVEYDDGSGVAVSTTIEMTGFIDQAADMTTRGIPVLDPIDAAADVVAKNIVLINNDDNFAGNAGNDNTMTAIVTYRLHDTLGL